MLGASGVRSAFPHCVQSHGLHMANTFIHVVAVVVLLYFFWLEVMAPATA